MAKPEHPEARKFYYARIYNAVATLLMCALAVVLALTSGNAIMFILVGIFLLTGGFSELMLRRRQYEAGSGLG